MKEEKEKEIDISDVFAGIRRFFSTIFYGIGRGILSTIYFIKRYWKILGWMKVLGIVAGLVYSLGGKPFYNSVMVIKSNDNQLEKNILIKILEEFNTMCEVEDFNGLSSLLNITEEQAKSLRKFGLEEETEIINYGAYYKKYFGLLSNIPDEEKRNEMLDSFIKSEKDNVFYVSASVYDASVLPLLNEPLAKLMNANPYFVRKRQINDITLKNSEQKIYEELSKLDSLKSTITSAINNSDKNMKSGTSNIFLGENQLYNPLPVYDKYLLLYYDAISLKKQLFFNENTVEVLSGFVRLTKNERLNPVLAALLGAFAGFLAGIFLVLGFLGFEHFRKLQIPSPVAE